jgi:RNA polymerase sigma-70 factor (ECF subfamily)
VSEEQALITALKSEQDRDKAFGQLVRQYKERLYWHIRNIVLDHDDTDDVLQNTFVKVFKHIDSFKGESHIYTWMFRIATNESLSFLKRKAKAKHITLHELKGKVIDGLESDVYFQGGRIEIQLQRAISTLPEKQQLIFNMKYFGQHTFEELSDILKTSVGGLKSNYHHAVKKITEFINNNDADLI